MRVETTLKTFVMMMLILCTAATANAQGKKKKKKKAPPPPVEEPAPAPPVEETPGWGAEPAPDTTQNQPVVEEPKVKPYERIVLDFDSVTNLIVYNGVVEQEDSPSDSIYLRAKKWIEKRWGKSVKFEADKRSQKIVFNAFLPAYKYTNKYTKSPMGRYTFKISIWIKEGRYKYSYSNFVHEGEKPNEGAPIRNYFEYYYTTTTNIKGVDQILRNADKDINELIKEMKKALKDPIIIDEDDW
jgi:hypothetical protein